MTHVARAAALAAALCVPVIADAQARNFSGTWALDRSKSTVTGLRTGESSPVRADGDIGPVPVGGDIRPPSKIKDVKPAYPAKAQRDRIEGMVIMEATIGVDGSVIKAEIIQSVPALDKAALDAVRQWKFTPTILRGVPVPVIMTVATGFFLGSAPPTKETLMRPPPFRPAGVSPSASGGAPTRLAESAGAAGQITITQTAETLTLTRDNPSGQTVTVYRFDGTESRNSVTYPPRGGGADPISAELVYRSRWDGDRLVTSISTPPGSAGPPERTQAIYLDGDSLVVETTGAGPGSVPVVQKLVYVRSSGRTR